MRLVRSRWILGPLVAVALATPAVRAQANDTEPAKKSSVTDEARPDGPPQADDGDAAEKKSEDDKPTDEPAAAGKGVPVPAMVPMFQRFGGRLRMIMRRNVAMPVQADEILQEESDSPRSVVLPDNGDIRRRLEKIRGEIADEHLADAARHLGQLLQNSEIRDFFLSRDEDRRDGRSFQTEVRRLIETLPPEGRAAYRAQFEAVARQQLNAAILNGGESALREVTRRFPSTAAGSEALYRLGQFLWDHGRPEAAAACLERLRGAPDAAAIEPAVSILLAACRQRAGQGAQFRAAVEELRTREIPVKTQIAGRPLVELLHGERVAEVLGEMLGLMVIAPPADEVDWSVFRGDPARNRKVAAGAPLLAARWTHEIAGDPQTQLSIEHSSRAYREGRGTYVPLLHPLAVGDLILMRTTRGVAAFDLATGDRLWQYPTDDDANNAGVDRLLWREPAGGAFAADAECFYLLEEFHSGGHEGTAAAVLSAREHFQSRQGRLRWQVGGADGGHEPALAGVLFLGPPLSWQGRLYVEIENRGAISLAALDVRTGRLEWLQELALVEESLGVDPFRKLAGATPSLSAEEIIVCPTSGGAVVAVDLTTQSLLWAYRYARRPQTTIAQDSEFEELNQPALDQHERWLDGTVAIEGDCAVLAPPESGELHCLDLHDGHPLWTQPRGDGLYVAGITEDSIIVVGRSQVRALRRTDGQPAWNAPVALPGSVFASGRGVFGQDGYYLPVTNGGILQINLKTGSVVGDYRSVREIAPGNLIWHRGSFLSLGPDYLQAFNERDAVERQVRERLERNPADATALLRRGELELTAGRLDDALAAFRQAHAAAPSGRTRSRLTSTLLDALRQERTDHRELLRELDQLAEQR